MICNSENRFRFMCPYLQWVGLLFQLEKTSEPPYYLRTHLRVREACQAILAGQLITDSYLQQMVYLNNTGVAEGRHDSEIQD